jgi:hypothetical protein
MTMPNERVIEATRFLVRDTNGVPRCVLGEHVDGSFGLVVSDAEARGRAALALHPSGDVTLDFQRTDGALACRLISRESLSGLTLSDPSGNPRLLAALDEDSRPTLTLLGAGLRPRAELKVTAEGPATLDLYDGEARLRVRVTIADDNTPSVTLADSSEHPRCVALVGADDTPAIFMSDGRAPRWAGMVPAKEAAALNLLNVDGSVAFRAP